MGFSQTDPSLPKPSDKIAALTTLAKHLGLLVERREVTGQMSVLNVTSAKPTWNPPAHSSRVSGQSAR